MLKDIRGLPITAFLAAIFSKVNNYFLKHCEKGKTYSTVLAPKQETEVKEFYDNR